MSSPRTHGRKRSFLRLNNLEARLAPATFTVTTDNYNGNGSLRHAVQNANSAAGADVIEFSSFFNSPRTITLSNQLSITGALTIDGTSAANVTISGNNAVRIFDTQSAPAGTAINLIDLTLKSGRVTGSETGAAVHAGDEALSALRCTFMGNTSAFGGGAISVDSGGSLSVTDCAFSTNSGAYAGGAIRAIGAGTLTATNCDFISNTVGSGIGGGGGAIQVDGGRSVTAADCLFSGNFAATGGGGAIRVSGAGTLTATNCDFTANSGGGALAGGSVTATNCNFTSNSGYSGGAIAGASVTATNCDFTANTSSYGGAIAGASVTATDSDFTNNTAYNSAGAIQASGPTVLTRCNISGNSVLAAYYSGGGGLVVLGTLLLEASTVSGNSALGSSGYYGYYPGYGGGISVAGNGATIRNCTISGNTASGGGGIHVTGSIVVQNSTITGNVANYYVHSGGILGQTIALESTIVANNSAGGGSDITAATVNATTSLIFNRSGIGTFNDLGGNRPALEDPRLAPLQNNGGPTTTHLLLPGSPCFNAGSNPANLTTDQRGAGFPRVVNGAIDMGAAEGTDVNPTATANSISPTITSAGAANYTVVVRYDDDVGIDLATIDLSDISVTGPGYAVPQTPTSLSIVGSGVLVTVTYTLPAPGGAFDFTDDGLYTITLPANQVGDSDMPVQHFVTARQLGTFRVAIPGTIEVDEPSDIDDGNIAEGHVSLREAIRLTNAAVATADTITFDPTVFGSPRTIAVTAGVYNVTDPLILIGPGADLLTLDGGGTSRLFFTNPTQPTNQVSLSGLTLTNASGGAILAIGGLTLSSVVVSNSQWLGGGGGGVGVIGSLTMLDCIVRNNLAAVGAGIYVSGPVVIQRSSINNNQASDSGGGMIVYNGPTVQISDSTFVNNQAGGAGGGLSFSGSGTVQISGTTFSGNTSNTVSSGIGGGGIFLSWAAAPGSYIRNSTISGNVAANGSPGGGLSLYTYGTLPIANSTITGNSTTGSGGGIAVTAGYYIGQGNISLNSTVISGNSAGTGPDLSFSYASNIPGGNNLIGVTNAGNFTLTGTGNLTGTVAAPVNAMLGALADNGGPTKTHALLPGSPAINAGNNAAGLSFDQRGAGFARNVNGSADIGAFELQTVAPPTAVLQINDGTAQRSRVTSLAVTFSAQVTFAGAGADAFTLTRTGGGSVAFTATPSIVGGVTVVTLNALTGGETEFGSLRDGRYTLTVLASQISANGQQMAGNATFSDAQGLFRLFGDFNGNCQVDNVDFFFFRPALGSSFPNPNYVEAFDFDGNGFITNTDLFQFRNRLGMLLP